MSRCKETGGILFDHPCRNLANAQCSSCSKPICASHTRLINSVPWCVKCIRTTLKDRRYRGPYAYFRDDPYFFWYFGGAEWMDDPYDEYDYRLFDHGTRGDLDSYGTATDHPWEGS